MIEHKRLDIQGLRAIAVLVVMIYHAGLPLTGGFVGVDIFFVISGFVISGTIARQMATSEGFCLWSFYIKRYKRLVPALALMVSLVALLSLLFQSHGANQSTTAFTALGAMLFGANIVIFLKSGGYFDTPAESNPLLHTWSLSVEEQFYFLFPLIMIFGWAIIGLRYKNRQRILFFSSLGAFCLISTFYYNGVSAHQNSSWWGFYSPLSRAWEFLAGVILALMPRPRMSVKQANVIGFTGLSLLLCSVCFIDKTMIWPGPYTIMPVLGTSLLLASGFAPSALTTRLLSARPMVLTGDWSYSLYLWHWPMIIFATIAIDATVQVKAGAAILSILPALLSYFYIEHPIRSAKFSSAAVWVKMLSFTVVVPVSLSLLLVLGSTQQWWLKWDRSDEHTAHIAIANCVDKTFDSARCTWVQANRKKPVRVLLVGDSQAYTYADGLIEAAKTNRADITVNSASGCPLLAVDTTGSKPINCQKWQATIVSHILETKPDIVFIANRASGYLDIDSGWRTFSRKDGHAIEKAELESVYRTALQSLLTKISPAARRVVIINDVPSAPVLSNRKSLFHRFAGAPAEEERFHFTGQAPSYRMMRRVNLRAAREYSNVEIFDPAKEICQNGLCLLTERHGRSVYSDKIHLSQYGSLLLRKPLENILISAPDRKRGSGR